MSEQIIGAAIALVLNVFGKTKLSREEVLGVCLGLCSLGVGLGILDHFFLGQCHPMESMTSLLKATILGYFPTRVTDYVR